MKILRILRIVLVFIYALVLLLLIPAFFMNYDGAIMRKAAEVFPLKYADEQNQNP